MTEQQADQVRQRKQLSKQAIALALQGQWREAVEVNRAIIESFPRDVDANNRLGRAHMELREYSKAREAYQQALSLDAYNTIAKKNLQRLAYLKDDEPVTEADTSKAKPQHFIEEVGKAGVVRLGHLAPREVLATIGAADTVQLRVDGTRLFVENARQEYIGQVDPKHAQRLIRLIHGGNRYTAAVSSVADDVVSVLIREEYQDPSQEGQLSFPPKSLRALRPFVRERAVRHELEGEEEEETLDEMDGMHEEGYVDEDSIVSED